MTIHLDWDDDDQFDHYIDRIHELEDQLEAEKAARVKAEQERDKLQAELDGMEPIPGCFLTEHGIHLCKIGHEGAERLYRKPEIK